VKRPVNTHRAPAAVGPYTQAIVADNFVFVSGQIPLDPTSGEMVEGGVEGQTRQVLRNIAAILVEANSSMDRVVRATVYLTDLGEFEAMNRVYGEVFTGTRPARVCVEVSKLPKGARVEIDAIAILK
jgi:2-iminobutanoate/2-iminopropanoate deaminase